MQVEDAERAEDEMKKWAEKHGEKPMHPVEHKVLAGSTQAETNAEELLSIMKEAGDCVVPHVVERNNADEEYDRLAASVSQMTLRGVVR